MIFKSLRAKLIAIYLLIVIVFIVCLGAVLTYSFRKNLTEMREKSILQCAEQIAEMYQSGKLGVVDLENGDTIPVLMTTAKDFDATIQIVNTTSKRYFYNMDSEKLTVYEVDIEVENEIYDTVYGKKEVYVKSNYYNKDMQGYVSTVAYPLMYPNSDVNDKPWAILIINSSLATINDTYDRIVSTLWVPAIIISVVGLFLIFFMLHGIVSRIEKLKTATHAIAKGKFDTRISFKQQDELGVLADDFNSMAAELAASDASKRDFVSNAAHELRSPMTSINGFVEGMLDGTIPQEKHKMYLEIVLSEVKRLTKLVQTMLDLSRIESGRDKINVVKTDINELIRRVIIRLGQKIENKGIIPEIDITDESLYVLADPDKIEQVLQNLVDNAIKFTGTDKCLFVSTVKKNNKVFVTVKDEGVGISSDEIKQIWDRFYTVDKARTGHKSGTGLGLSIVKSIIDQHGQEITVSSEVDKGTEFVFTLDSVEV